MLPEDRPVLAPEAPALDLPRTFAAAGRWRRTVEIHVDEAGITRTDTRGFIALRWDEIRLIARRIGGAIELLGRGAAADIPFRGWTALQRSVFEGHTGIVDAPLAAGADPNAQTDQAGAALFIAADRGHVAIARALLDRGANANAAWGRWTPLQVATLKRQEAVRALLLERGAIQ